MKKIFFALTVLVGVTFGVISARAEPPKVGEFFQREATICDTLEQATEIVTASKEMGWDEGGAVIWDHYYNTVNERGNNICGIVSFVGKVVAVNDMGYVPYKDEVRHIWLLTVEGPITDNETSGVMFYSEDADPEV